MKAYAEGVRHFEKLLLDKLEELISGNFVDLSDRQNEAPSIKKIYEFVKRYPERRTVTQSPLCVMITVSA
ncbi:MAG: hypothetical protein IKI76_03855 [Selenomonadaceae bacterium]|nr:hypothetical protein [Selenomonadaceae bacterium]